MAEERDPLVSRRYRELGSDEPPPGLDERILASSRRRRPFQWHGPVAAAAVIVLAVAVTVHVEREQSVRESVPTSQRPQVQGARKENAQPAKPYEEARPQEKAKVEQRQRRDTFTPDPPKAQAPAPSARSDSATAPSEPQPAAPAQRALEAQRAPVAGAAADSAAKPMPSPESKLAKSRAAELAEQPPEKWLEGIAELRAQGRHEEADESLKRFRERYPDYQIPEETLARIQKK